MSRESDAFERCLAVQGAARQSVIDEVCAGDAELRARLLRLLEIHDRSVSYKTEGFVAGAVEEVTPKSIGAYRLMRPVGAGGMGEVWIGEQDAPVKRTVAIKLIRAGMDTREVLARFEVERQALALMNHPNIAQIYDAGSTPNGRPYYVMEMVEGEPITAWCDAQGCDLPTRLRLLLDVCGAVNHAHQKGVIHRDLKPSNVLIATDDEGRPRVKVIDFGIAKPSDRAIVAATLTPATLFGDILGTPEYMSPEQAGAINQDLDTRADVYSLGALLYELLCGCAPLVLPSAKRDTEEFRRVVRDVVPPAASARFAEPDGAQRALARGGTAGALARQVRGDLDCIALKALEKDRERRYQSVAALADDIARHLAGEPIEARPPDLRYRLGRYARRHQGLLAAVMAVLASVAVVAGLFAYRLAEERDLARLEAQRAEKMAGFLVGVFKITDAFNQNWVKLDREAARRMLGRAQEQIDAGELGDPAVEAKLLGAMGETYTGYAEANQGDLAKARQLLERAAGTRRRLHGEDDLEALAYDTLIGRTYRHEHDFERATAVLERTLDRFRSGPGAGSADHATAAMDLGAVFLLARRFPEAIQAAEEARAILEGEPPGFKIGELAAALEMLASVNQLQGATQSAVELYRRAIEMQRSLPAGGARDMGLARTYGNLALALPIDDPERVALMRQSLEILKENLGPDSPRLAPPYYNLASLLRKTGRAAEAVPYSEEALRLARVMLAANHPQLSRYAENHAMALLGAGRLAEAAEVAESSVRMVKERKDANVGDRASSAFVLGSVRAEQGRSREAETLLRAAVDLVDAQPAETRTKNDQAVVRQAAQRLSELYRRRGDPQAAERWAKRAAAT